MRVLIDGDACPQRDELAKMAKAYQISVIVFADYAHVVESDDYEVRTCEISKDSVDMAIVDEVQRGDLVITQDYGLASFVLVKGALVLHVSGMRINQENIEELLLKRYIGYKQRHKDKHLHGPKRRTQETEVYFMKQFQKILDENRG